MTLVLDSLSWLLLRLPPPRLCQALGALLGEAPGSGEDIWGALGWGVGEADTRVPIGLGCGGAPTWEWG